MRRGEVVVVELDPAVGNEQGKTRPAVVVSNDSSNSVAERNGRGVVTVVPVTSNVQRVLSFQALLSASSTGLLRPSKAQAEQVRSVAVQRVVRTLGAVTAVEMAAIDEALRVHLDL